MTTDTGRRVSVAVSNDYEVVVRGVAAMLSGQPGLEVVDLTVDETLSCTVDVVLHDTFGDADTLTETVTRIGATAEVGRVVVFTSIDDDRAVADALGSGAAGFVHKGVDASVLAEAVRRVAAGEQVVLARRDDAPPSLRWPGRQFGLTEGEAASLALLLQGLSNAEIADLLYVNVNTVKARLKNVFRKIEVDNRVRAAVWAMRHGFEPDGRAAFGPRC